MIDDTQVNLLEVEEKQAKDFYTAYLNNVRALIAIFDALLPKEAFIMLPGDEIIEKKHQNIKMLTAAMTNTDMSKRPTRSWPGLGANTLIVDYEALAPAEDQDESGPSRSGTPAPE